MDHRSPYQTRKAKAIAIARKADLQRRVQVVLTGALGVLGLVLLLREWAM